MSINLSPPRKLDGSKPDQTGGRGFVDDKDVTRLGRAAKRLEVQLVKAMSAVEAFADDNFAFNRIPLTKEEESEIFMKMSRSDLEQAAGIFGVEKVVKSQRDVVNTMVKRRVPTDLNINQMDGGGEPSATLGEPL
jgi:hypothetical protein